MHNFEIFRKSPINGGKLNEPDRYAFFSKNKIKLVGFFLSSLFVFFFVIGIGFFSQRVTLAGMVAKKANRTLVILETKM